MMVWINSLELSTGAHHCVLQIQLAVREETEEQFPSAFQDLVPHKFKAMAAPLTRPDNR